MKKIYTLCGCVALSLGFGAVAQQLTNADFESAWVDCVPWALTKADGTISTVVTGQNPTGWVVSNVCGMGGLGATTVGANVDGFNSASAVKLTNSANPLMASQIVPAYLSLGTTWSTSKVNLATFQPTNSDGGVFGGVEFTERPIGIEFMYKRSRGTANPGEKSTVVAYLWKGHWTQKAVPANISLGKPFTVDMVDRDRCVLGMSLEGCQGSTEVIPTEDAELIAVINAEIITEASEWTKFAATFEYKSDANPEMINIVIASGDYFGGPSVVGLDNSLIVDDVKLVYAEETDVFKYPGSLTIDMGGAPLTPEPMPAEVQIEYTADDKCTLTLPNFTLDLGSGPANLGDIVVPGVVVETANNVANYTGKVNGLQLYEGQIVADVIVNGTIDSSGVAVFNIDVVWNNIPIVVVFNGKGAPGKGTSTVIETVVADSDAEAVYYNINGVRVNGDNLAPGLYIERKGSAVRKVLVR